MMKELPVNSLNIETNHKSMCGKYSINHNLNLVSQSKLNKISKENNQSINKHQVCERRTNKTYPQKYTSPKKKKKSPLKYVFLSSFKPFFQKYTSPKKNIFVKQEHTHTLAYI